MIRMSLVDQLPALIGVIVGAGLSFTSTTVVERGRWRRGQAVRWDERKLTAYAEFGNAVKDMVLLANRIAGGRGLNEHPQPLAPDPENLTALAEAAAKCSLLNEQLRLLADEDTITASRALNHRAYRLEWFAYGRLDGGPDAWAAAYLEYRDARDEYLGHARASLQVAGPGIPRDRGWHTPSTPITDDPR
jgi:hypothetical protein